MYVNVEKLKISVDKLNDLIDDYENVFLNLYSQISSSSDFWKDNKSKKFFLSVKTEKLKISNTIDELKQLTSVYDFLIRKYENFGNKLKFELNLKDDILVKFDNYLDKIYEIINIYKDLELEFCSDIAVSLYNQMDELIKIGNETVELKEKVKEYFNQISDIEKEVSLKISHINIEIIKESEIKEFI